MMNGSYALFSVVFEDSGLHLNTCMHMCEQGYCDRCWCPHIYVCVYLTLNSLNGKLLVDAPFYTLVVGISSNL